MVDFAKTNQQQKDSSSTNGGKTTRNTCKKMNLDPYFIPYIKVKSKWLTESNVKN